MVIVVSKEDLTRVLLLLIANNHILASKAGLGERGKNRWEAITELLFMLSLTVQEAEDLYQITLEGKV